MVTLGVQKLVFLDQPASVSCRSRQQTRLLDNNSSCHFPGKGVLYRAYPGGCRPAWLKVGYQNFWEYLCEHHKYNKVALTKFYNLRGFYTYDHPE
jgi:hypothetical protein